VIKVKEAVIAATAIRKILKKEKVATPISGTQYTGDTAIYNHQKIADNLFI